MGGPGSGRRVVMRPARDERMIRMYRAGYTIGDIGPEFGLTRARVHQILRKLGITAEQGGRTLKREQRRRRLQVQSERLFQERIGGHLTRAAYRQLIQAGVPQVYRAKKQNSQRLGITWELTFMQWWDAWQRSGHWSDRGRGKGKWAMCCIGSICNPETVRILPFEEAIPVARGDHVRH